MAAIDEELAYPGMGVGLLGEPVLEPFAAEGDARDPVQRHPMGPRGITVLTRLRGVRGGLLATALLGICAVAATQLWRPVALKTDVASEGVVALREEKAKGPHAKLTGILTEDSPVDVGWKVVVESQTGHRRECTIAERDDSGHRLRIHYDNFPSAYDEWIPIDSSRIVEVEPTTTTTTTTQTTTTQTTTSITTTTKTATSSTSTSSTTLRKYVSLFCFTMTRADAGNTELSLVRMQLEKRIGIFDCDEQIVFSDQETWLSAGPTLLKNAKAPILITTFPVAADLSDAKDDSLKAAWLNAGDYVKCWQQVVLDGTYRWHDWTVKVDPDTVFLPGRLRDYLKQGFDSGAKPMYLTTCATTPRKCTNSVTVSRQYGPEMTIQVVGASTDTYSISGTCHKELLSAQPCIANGWGDGVHVVVNQNGKVIGEGNCCNEQNEVKLVGYDCAQQQFESHEPGMSGALEIVSKAAVDLYGENGHRCKADAYLDMGEDFFMQECFKLLGCETASGEALLQDDYCSGLSGDCSGPQVAFHPFKTLEDHITCAGHAFMDLSTPELHADLLLVSRADG